jgi:hypothetical protein
LFQAGPVGFCSFSLWFQQIIADISPGNIHFRADIVQNVIPKQELAAYSIVVGSEALQYSQGVYSSEGHDSEETAKSDD